MVSLWYDGPAGDAVLPEALGGPIRPAGGALSPVARWFASWPGVLPVSDMLSVPFSCAGIA